MHSSRFPKFKRNSSTIKKNRWGENWKRLKL
jgi:hypothetical protein